MKLETKIDEKHYKITIKGEQKEIENFLYCIEQAVTKGIYKDLITEYVQQAKERQIQTFEQINLTTIHRAYYKKNEIQIIPNKGNQEFYFPIIKKTYQDALELYTEYK